MKTAFAWRFVRLCLFIALATAPYYSRAQTLNSCGTKAVIAPVTGDTIMAPGTSILLSSASTNATEYRWLYNGLFIGISNKDLNYGVGVPGIHTINLVAINGNCRDTATVVIFSPGTGRAVDSMQLSNYGFYNSTEFGNSLDHTPDDGFIIGADSYKLDCGIKGLVVKLKKGGCIEWSKSFRRSFNCDVTEIKSVHSSPDSNYYVLLKSGELLKLDRNGNLLWTKKWGFDVNSSYYLGFEQMCLDPAGNLYGVARVDPGALIAKIDPNGNMLWNRLYGQGKQFTPPTPSDYSYPFGISYMSGRLYVTGLIFNRSAPPLQYYSFLTSVDAITGTAHWQYGYSDEAIGTNHSKMLFDRPTTYGDLVLVPGHNGGLWATLIDTAGSLRKTIKAEFGLSYYPAATRAATDSKGNIIIMQQTVLPAVQWPLQTRQVNIAHFVKIDTALNKLWGMSYEGAHNQAEFRDATLNKKDVLAAVGSESGYVDDDQWGSRDVRFLKIDSASIAPPPGSCDYSHLNYNLSAPALTRIHFNWTIDSVINLVPLNTFPVLMSDAFVKSRYSCPDFIDSCSLLRLSGPTDLCSPQQTYTYRIHRNRKCALLPTWKLPANVTIIQQTDTTIRLRFNGTGLFRITATLQGCVPATDSLLISVTYKTPPPTLGKDTILCAGTSIRLRAGTRYVSYEWIDGSTDSLLTINQPGLFWVRVIDSCGNVYRDSITVAPYSNEGLSAGPDRTKCNNDTLHITASPGFLNYTWSNNYNINSLTTASVIVHPTTDTAYYVRAEKIPGCFAYDTVRIRVHHSPPIQLGADRRFCAGDSTLLDAGAGFQQYLWSSGQMTSSIIVKNPGEYRVQGTTAEGCKSFDTILVLPSYSLPQPVLDKNNALCTGTARILSPGNFSAYQWSTGATTPTLTIGGVGQYSVAVVDANGCKGSDSTTVSIIHPLPLNFLPPDTAVCSYGKLELKASSSFNRYAWSNGATSSAITISAPGLYWLQATDANNCSGRDSVLVNPKECLRGLYVPTAFTPKNDLLKGRLFGDIKTYSFRIYNRWGHMVFQTADPAKGWDGKVGGIDQESNVFVWTCTYQLQGEPVKSEKGSFLLIR